jgi:hypothetical protein
LARHAGQLDVVKKAQAPLAAKRRMNLRAHQVTRGKGLVQGDAAKSNLRSSNQDRAVVERTLALTERGSLRGDPLDREPIEAWRIAFTRCVRPGAAMRCGRGNRPLHALGCMTEGARSGRGGASYRRKATRTFARVGRSAWALASSEAFSARKSSEEARAARCPSLPRKRPRQRANAGVKHVASRMRSGFGSPWSVPVHHLFAEIGRASSARRSAPSASRRSKARAKQEVGGSELASAALPLRVSARSARGEREAVRPSPAILIT